jgi:nitrogen fixation protein FixH
MSPLVRKERIWPMIIAGILLVDVGVGFGMMKVANSDPHGAVESNYYQKAITWDSTMAQSERNATLGWTLVPALGAITAPGNASLSFTLRDQDGAPISGAVILVEAVQVAHADQIVHVTLTSSPDGSYATAIPMTRAGLWELRVIATRGADRFTSQVRLDASTTGMATVVTARPGDASPAELKAGLRPAGS